MGIGAVTEQLGHKPSLVFFYSLTGLFTDCNIHEDHIIIKAIYIEQDR